MRDDTGARRKVIIFTEHKDTLDDLVARLTQHLGRDDAVVTILDGKCEVWIDGETFELSEGDTIIMPANKPHALSAITPFKMTLTMIRE